MIQTDDFPDFSSKTKAARFSPGVVIAGLTCICFISSVAFLGCVRLLQRTIWTQNDDYISTEPLVASNSEEQKNESNSFSHLTDSFEKSIYFKYLLYFIWLIVFGGLFHYIPAIQPYAAVGYGQSFFRISSILWGISVPIGVSLSYLIKIRACVITIFFLFTMYIFDSTVLTILAALNDDPPFEDSSLFFMINLFLWVLQGGLGSYLSGKALQSQLDCKKYKIHYFVKRTTHRKQLIENK